MPLSNITTGSRAARNAVFAALSMLTVASCAAQEDLASYPCPLVISPREFSYMTKFEGESQDLSDTLFEAKLDSILPAANCIYRDENGKRSIVYDIRLQFLAQRGPKDREGIAKFTYFVTITGENGQFLKGEQFPTEIVFENNATQAITVEEIQPTIPLKEGETGDYRRIYVGFALSAKEEDYNRKNPR